MVCSLFLNFIRCCLCVVVVVVVVFVVVDDDVIIGLLDKQVLNEYLCSLERYMPESTAMIEDIRKFAIEGNQAGGG